jgi:hypothetical protein
MSTSDSSLDSSVDSASPTSTSSAEESVRLESRRDSFEIATTGTDFSGVSLWSSLLLSVPT